MGEVAFLCSGEAALVVQFGDAIDERINARVVSLDAELSRRPVRGIVETVPTYRSLLVYYDPSMVSYRSLVRRLSSRVRSMGAAAVGRGRLFEIPVLYGGEAGPDLGEVAAHAKLSEAETITRHSGREYRIYMLGFLPGFAYLGGLDPVLSTPRLSTPRLSIPAGSVGIAGGQTGIYPLVSPGGWRLIGLTPVRVYDPGRTPPVFYGPGDRIRFRPVDAAEFDRIRGLVEKDEYSYAIDEGGEGGH